MSAASVDLHDRESEDGLEAGAHGFFERAELLMLCHEGDARGGPDEREAIFGSTAPRLSSANVTVTRDDDETRSAQEHRWCCCSWDFRSAFRC